MSETPQRRSPFGVSLCRWSLAWFFRGLTAPGRRAVSRTLAWLWFDVLRFRRRLILDNLARAFPDWPEARRRAVGKSSLYHLSYSAIEAFMLPFLTREKLPALVTFHGAEHRDAALASGRGALGLGMHLGSVEVMMAVTALDGLKSHVIAKKFRSRFLTALIYGTRESFGTKFIDPHGERTAFEILQACRRNESVAFVLDQAARKGIGIACTFFGRPASTAYGLALFALKTRAPVVPIYSYRDDDHRLHVCFGPAVPPVDDKDRTKAIHATTQRYNDVIESLIRQHPEQWMWVHNRWKAAR